MVVDQITRDTQAEIKEYNVMIDGHNFFDQPVKNNLKT